MASSSVVSSAPLRAASSIRPAHRIAFIQSSWHKDIVDQCRIAFAEAMLAHGYSHADIDYFEVSGAFEIPLHARLLAQQGRYAGIVAAGLVVDGGIYRHDFVASAVIDGLMRVQLDSNVPVFSAVLTPHHFHSGAEHVSFFTEHFVVKGREVAHACADTIRKIAEINDRAQAPKDALAA